MSSTGAGRVSEVNEKTLLSRKSDMRENRIVLKPGEDLTLSTMSVPRRTILSLRNREVREETSKKSKVVVCRKYKLSL